MADVALLESVEEISGGLMDANLGGHVFKKPVGIAGRGKRSGARTLLALQVAERACFLYGYAKNRRANVSDKELQALKRSAAELLGYDDRALARALQAGELHEVENNE